MRSVTHARRLAQSTARVAQSAKENDLYKWGRFDWQDPFNMDARLSDDEKMFRDSFRRYCDEKLMTRIVMDNRNNRKCFEKFRKNSEKFKKKLQISIVISCTSWAKWAHLV